MKLTQRLDALREHVDVFTDTAIGTAALHEQQALYASIAATAAAGALALLLSSLVISGILRPMRALSLSASRVEKGDFEIELKPQSRDEIGALTTSFNTMVTGLRSTQKIKDTFGQYLDPRVVSGLIADESDATAGEKKVVSAYFSDLADFTTISEQFTPSGLVRVLNRYLDLMSSEITDRQGVIDKLYRRRNHGVLGAALLRGRPAGYTGCEKRSEKHRTPAPVPNRASGTNRSAEKTCPRSASASVSPLAKQSSVQSVRRKPKNYTVMGDTVNLGARLEGANKIYGTQLLVCERTRDMAQGLEFRAIDHIQVKGKTEPTRVYTALAETGELTEIQQTLQMLSDKALADYTAGKWAEAADSYKEILRSEPEDPIAKVFLNRLDLISRDGAPANWDGVWHLTSK